MLLKTTTPYHKVYFKFVFRELATTVMNLLVFVAFLISSTTTFTQYPISLIRQAHYYAFILCREIYNQRFFFHCFTRVDYLYKSRLNIAGDYHGNHVIFHISVANTIISHFLPTPKAHLYICYQKHQIFSQDLCHFKGLYCLFSGGHH